MARVVLEVSKLHWLDIPAQETDLCAHGAVRISIADEVLSDGKEADWCVSASALQLLRTLNADHSLSTNDSGHLIEHCGHAMFPSANGGDITLMGCNVGIDFAVIHSSNDVTLTTANGTAVTISLPEWASIVARFSDEVQSFYDRSPVRRPQSHTDAEGYSGFRAEWARRRKDAAV